MDAGPPTRLSSVPRFFRWLPSDPLDSASPTMPLEAFRSLVAPSTYLNGPDAGRSWRQRTPGGYERRLGDCGWRRARRDRPTAARPRLRDLLPRVAVDGRVGSQMRAAPVACRGVRREPTSAQRRPFAQATALPRRPSLAVARKRRPEVGARQTMRRARAAHRRNSSDRATALPRRPAPAGRRTTRPAPAAVPKKSFDQVADPLRFPEGAIADRRVRPQMVASHRIC